MNSELSIPIDTRPNHGTPAGHRNNGYGPFGSQSHQHRGNFNSIQNVNLPSQNNLRYQHQQPNSPRNQGMPTSHFAPHSSYNQPPGSIPWTNRSNINPYSQYQPASQIRPHQSQNQPSSSGRGQSSHQHLYQPGVTHGRARGRSDIDPQDIITQGASLQALVHMYVPQIKIEQEEEAEKEAFRAVIEEICQTTIAEFEQKEVGNEKFDPSSVKVLSFGSMASGFASKGSDLDLALVTPKSQPLASSPESPLPRLLEKKLLDMGYGARLLTKARVPIIKLCQLPSKELLTALVDARTKWENGFIVESADAEETLDTDIDVKTKVVVKEVSIEESTNMDASKASLQLKSPEQVAAPELSQQPGLTTDEKPEVDLQSELSEYEKQLAKLKQTDGQSIREYYQKARNLLRKLGGHDITRATPGVTEEEAKILNNVLKAFINGLQSVTLAARLRTYLSLRDLLESSYSSGGRSLDGLATQCEGEMLSMNWESRTLLEVTDALELNAQKIVEDWKNLNNTEIPIFGTLDFDRQLVHAADRLKSIPSLRLAVLTQLPSEAAIHYCNRTKKLVGELTPSIQLALNNSISTAAISHYIAGIANRKIREHLQNCDCDGLTLEQIGFHHRSLEHANDTEKALEGGAYEESAKQDIEQYIAFLRNRKPDGDLNVSESELVDKIGHLASSARTPIKSFGRNELDFPGHGVGIQCDINFSAQLAIHNTQLLRCYSYSDPRVKEMVLFVKHWAKVRGINDPYRGTLSSYGYVLMVLQYLVNVAQPNVCPNLQLINKDPPPYLPPDEILARSTCEGLDVRFWRNEIEIKNLAARKMLNHNHDSIGHLLRGFFEYYAQGNDLTTVKGKRGFNWHSEVLSLRTPGGLLSKQEKNWVEAKTVIEKRLVAAPLTPTTATIDGQVASSTPSSTSRDGPEAKAPKHIVRTIEETKEVKHRYLFAIEDPFELDHNVARTVFHPGIVNIRDEFRRAWKIIESTGKAWAHKNGGLLDPLPPQKSNETFRFMQEFEKVHKLPPKDSKNMLPPIL